MAAGSWRARGLREAAGLSPPPAFNLQRARLEPSPARAGDAAAARGPCARLGLAARSSSGREGGRSPRAVGLGVPTAPRALGRWRQRRGDGSELVVGLRGALEHPLAMRWDGMGWEGKGSPPRSPVCGVLGTPGHHEPCGRSPEACGAHE